jgi:hypothetical protein
MAPQQMCFHAKNRPLIVIREASQRPETCDNYHDGTNYFEDADVHLGHADTLPVVLHPHHYQPYGTILHRRLSSCPYTVFGQTQ